jgi:integrase
MTRKLPATKVHMNSLTVPSEERRGLVERGFTSSEVETLQRMRQKRPNSQRATDGDLDYLETWYRAVVGETMAWPISPDMAVKFIAHHFGSMPIEVLTRISEASPRRLLKGQLSTNTVKRMITTWRVRHDQMGVDNPLRHPAFSQLLRDAVRSADDRPGRKSRKAVMRKEMQSLLATNARDNDPGALLRDLRDRAMLLFGFASGGRRRSEIAGLRAENLERHELQTEDGAEALTYRVYLGQTKTTRARDDVWVELSGVAALAMEEWLETTAIEVGPVFRKINLWGQLSDDQMTTDGVNYVLKQRLAMAGLNPKDFSAHGLRSGFLTQCGRDGITLQEAMEMSLHRDPRTAMRYFNDGKLGQRRAAKLLDVASPVVPQRGSKK